MTEIRDILEQIDRTSTVLELKNVSRAHRKYIHELAVLTKMMKDTVQDSDAQKCLDAEMACITFEQTNFGDTEKKKKQYNDQIELCKKADESLQDVLNVPGYKAKFEELQKLGFSGSMPEKELYETFVSDQNRYLENAKSGLTSPVEEVFFSVRQANLRVGLKQFKQLQEEALFPERVAAKAVAQEIVGENGKVFRADPKGTHCYKGEILTITETHAIQRYSKSAVYIHARKDFPEGKQPSMGENLALHYTDGKITSVEHIQPKSQTKTQQKDLGR